MYGLEGVRVYLPPAPGAEVQSGPSPMTRLGALLRRARLDARLAAGADPCESPTLGYRAAQLTSDRGRQKVAAWLERALVAANRPAPRISGAIEPHRGEVRAATRRLLYVRKMLRSSTPVYACGVAMLKGLLQDGGGPLYRPVWPGELDQSLALVIAALEGQEQREGPDLLDD